MSNLQSLKETEQREWVKEFGLEVQDLSIRKMMTDWLKAHDQRLLTAVVEMVEKVMDEKINEEMSEAAELGLENAKDAILSELKGNN